MKKTDLAGKEKTELEDILLKSRKELVDLKMDNALGKLKNPHAISAKRREFARILTKIRTEELTK